ncbi:MAG: mRNA-degrading endonuclease RelE of RelBE toxin-antitoxin system [Verrucomicrobiales bacterium]
MLQVVFNEISAAELSQLPTMAQLELLDEFQVDPADLESIEESDAYGVIDRKGKKLYRYRAKDMRLYFQVSEGNVVVHRVLHKNTLQDFLYRSKLPLAEDEAVSQSKVFWELIEEGQNARRV